MEVFLNQGSSQPFSFILNSHFCNNIENNDSMCTLILEREGHKDGEQEELPLVSSPKKITEMDNVYHISKYPISLLE
jgi:hypothetical protein